MDTLLQTFSWGEVSLRITGDRNLATHDSNFSSVSAKPRRRRTRSKSSVKEDLPINLA